MRVFDLRCEHDHRFEGWFASSDAYEDQLKRDLVACPMCASTVVTRVPSAPHLNLSTAREVVPSSITSGNVPSTRTEPGATMAPGEARSDRGDDRDRSGEKIRDKNAREVSQAQSSGRDTRLADASRQMTPEAKTAERLQAQWLNMIREVVRNTENVGDAFAEEARKMHYREAPERAIRGVASPDQVAELADEGIDVVAMPMPDAIKGSLQ